jgi:hypothetical protein
MRFWPTTPGRRDGARPRWKLLAAVGALAVALAWCRFNLGFTRPDRVPVDAAIRAACGFLEQGKHFRDTGSEGTNPVEVWLARRVVDRTAFPGLAEDLERTSVVFRETGQWAFVQPLPDEPPYVLSDTHRTTMRAWFESRPGSAHFSLWNLWLSYALHPEVGELDAATRRRFLGGDPRDWFGYNLTHRLFAYRLMRAMHPTAAADLGLESRERVAELIAGLETTADVSISDLYLERVAFLLDVDDRPPLFLSRWVERILADQAPDGGWAFPRSLRCTLGELLGVRCSRGRSDPHPTLLAAFALARYRELYLGGSTPAGTYAQPVR